MRTVTQAGPNGITARPDPGKVAKWQERIDAALRSGSMCTGLAKKLAGALSWGASALFRRVGRAMLRSLTTAARACCGDDSRGKASLRAHKVAHFQAE